MINSFDFFCMLKQVHMRCLASDLTVSLRFTYASIVLADSTLLGHVGYKAAVAY